MTPEQAEATKTAVGGVLMLIFFFPGICAVAYGVAHTIAFAFPGKR